MVPGVAYKTGVEDTKTLTGMPMVPSGVVTVMVPEIGVAEGVNPEGTKLTVMNVGPVPLVLLNASQFTVLEIL